MKLVVDDNKIYIYNYGWNIEETVYATVKDAGCSPRKSNLIEKNNKTR